MPSLYSGKALDFDGVNDYVDLAGLTFSGNNQSFCFYLKADAWNNFDYIFDIFSNRFIIGSQPANNLSIYDGASWQSFGEIDDTINTNFFVVTIEGTTSKDRLQRQNVRPMWHGKAPLPPQGMSRWSR